LKKNNLIKKNYFKTVPITENIFEKSNTFPFHQKFLSVLLLTFAQTIVVISLLSNLNSSFIESQNKKILLEKVFGLTFDHPFSNLIFPDHFNDLSSTFSELVINLNILI